MRHSASTVRHSVIVVEALILPSSLEFSFIWPLFRRRWIRPAAVVDHAAGRQFRDFMTRRSRNACVSTSDRHFSSAEPICAPGARRRRHRRAGAFAAHRNAHKRERIARARRNASERLARFDNNRHVHARSSARFPTARDDHKIAANQGVGVRDAARVIVHVGKGAPM
jgi:hypothetical protein